MDKYAFIYYYFLQINPISDFTTSYHLIHHLDYAIFHIFLA